MVIAKMFPLVVEPVRRRCGAYGRDGTAPAPEFTVGYMTRWLLFGAPACGIVFAVRSVGWTCAISPCRCAAKGWRANRDSLRFRWTAGGGCLVSCWA